MENQLLSAFFQIGIIVIISLFFIRDFKKKTIQNLFLAIFFFLIMSFLLYLPIEYQSLKFTNTSWNFSGKIYSILFSTLFFICFKKRFQEHNYIKIEQKRKSFYKVLPILVFLIILAFLDGLQRESKIWNSEYFLYQMTMPPIDEELAYRGILLGLFSTILLEEIKIFSVKINPSVLITGILFGIIHGLKIYSNWDFSFNAFLFVKTFIYGIIWGWITVKTKSILVPILFHNLSNTMPFLISLLK